MATFVGNNNRVYLGQLDLSGLANQVDFGPLSAVMQDCTTFNDGGFTCVKPGLKSGEAMIHGYQDYATGVLDDTIGMAQLGSQYPITVIPNPTGTVTAADPCWFSRGIISKINPLEIAVGEMGGFSINTGFDAAFPQGKVAAPLTTTAATFTGTAVALTGPTAAQKLYVALHVTAYSGFTNVIFTVESDNAVGFPSTTTRITLTTVTGVTSQFASVAGDFSTETHHRIVATKTGTGSITFAAAFGVL